jgi:hypothetical protein
VIYLAFFIILLNGAIEMSESKALLNKLTITCGFICSLLLLSSTWILGDTYDDDTTIEFYWEAASGNVDHYDVHVSVYRKYHDPNSLLNTTTYTGPSAAPTQGNPYALPSGVNVEDGKGYRLKVNAVGPGGEEGPMSEESDIVWCKLRSPGDQNGQKPGDANGNMRVGAGDWGIILISWGTDRGDIRYDYRADFDYDDSIGLSDLIIIAGNWGRIYGDGYAAPTPIVPIAAGGRCKAKISGQTAIEAGSEFYVDIMIEDAKDIYSMDFEVSFDPGIVKVEEIERGTFFNNLSVNALQSLDSSNNSDTHQSDSWIAGEINHNHGKIFPTLAAVPTGVSKGKAGSGVIARLKITAISAGVSPISVKNIHAYDSELNPLAISSVNSTLKVDAAKFRLEQNYPNPFNPETWIPYSLAEGCDKVTIIIYSSLGEEIRRLELGRRDAGNYSTKDRAAYWDGKNEHGIRVASGIYFYQIEADEFSSVRKMVVLK